MRIKKLVLFCMLCLALSVFGSTAMMLGGCDSGCGAPHEWIDATCTAPRTCLTCGEIKGQPLGHTWDQEVCGTDKICLTCGEVEEYGHIVEVDEGYAATCEADGLTEGSHCSRCETVFVEQEAIPAIGHNYVLTIAEATCLAPETHTYECSNCLDTYTEQYGEVTDHDIEGVKPSGNIHVLEMCMVISYYTCKDCGTRISVYKTEHTYVLVDKVEATCVSDGYEEYRCRYCKNEKTEIIPALSTAHTWIGEATCENGTSCSGCGAEKPAIGHKYVLTITEATCLAPETHTYECSNCLHSYSEQYGEVADHDIEGVKPSGGIHVVEMCMLISYCKCKDCGTRISVYTTEHTYVLISTIEPTHDAEGSELYRCRYCKHEKVVILPALSDEE